MNIKPLVEQTIDRVRPKLSQLRKAFQNRKPKDLVPPGRPLTRLIRDHNDVWSDTVMQIYTNTGLENK